MPWSGAGSANGQPRRERAAAGRPRAVTELLRHLLTATAPETAAAMAVSAARDATGAEVSWCGLVHDDRLHMAAHSGLRTARMANEWQLPVGVGVGGRVAAEGRTLLVRDYRHDPRRAPAQKTMIDAEGIVSAVCAPLISGEHAIGVLYAAQRSAYTWSPAEMDLVTELAADCGAAIARLLRPAELGSATGEATPGTLEAALGLQADLAEVLGVAGDLAGGLTMLSRRLGLNVDLVDAGGQSVLGPESAQEPVQYRIALPGAAGQTLTVRAAHELDPGAQASARAAATVFGMQLRVSRANAAAERRAARDLLDALISGTADPPRLRSDAALLGLDLRQAHHVVCVGAFPAPSGAAGDAVPLGRAAVEQLERAVASEHAGSLVVARSGDLVLVLPTRAGHRPAERVRELLSARTLPVEGLAAGIGRRCTAPHDFVESFGEATLALDLARRQAEPGAVFTAADLGLSGLLAASGSSRATLEAMVQSTLGPVLDADRRDRSAYVRTLRAWLAQDRHLERTAAVLHVHPNTVRYRIGRAQDLLGLDLRNVDDRFQIDLALRVLDALDGSTPQVAPSSAEAG